MGKVWAHSNLIEPHPRAQIHNNWKNRQNLSCLKSNITNPKFILDPLLASLLSSHLLSSPCSLFLNCSRASLTFCYLSHFLFLQPHPRAQISSSIICHHQYHHSFTLTFRIAFTCPLQLLPTCYYILHFRSSFPQCLVGNLLA